jgi:uncharacterized membrane protein YbaN (DUF454 family)
MQMQGKGRGRKFMRQVSGYFCISIGIVGCVLPILPGIPLLFVGLGLLAVDSPRAARLRDRLKEYVNRQVARVRRKAAPKPPPAKDPSEDSAY